MKMVFQEESFIDNLAEERSSQDARMDVRTPLEFEEDRITGSVNWPVLSNEERAEVGTLYAR